MARLLNPSESKVSRAIRLDSELDAQLLIVCKGLGVNPNAFLKQAVGEAIYKHMAPYRQQEAMTKAVSEKMAEVMMAMAAQEQDKDVPES